ncbi:MAG: iron-sulfur cluster assembly protein [Bacteroidales bacterium]|jgi:FeS assembly SUF system protein|nr:iron-sulfur cluster assembly protein [Bacteroidales bacterium]
MIQTEVQIVRMLRNVYDPEIPVNIYDLGLIYEVNVGDEGKVDILMTLTSPGCPMADQLVAEIRERILEIEEVKSVEVKITFNPSWNRDMMTDEAKLELGFL